MRLARGYLLVQALAGALWWITVATVPAIRAATLGTLDPLPIAVLDVPLFVVGSMLAAARVPATGIVVAGWTSLVAVLLSGWATVTGTAGWGAVVMIAAAGGTVLAVLQLRLGRLPSELLLRGPFAARPFAGGRRASIAATLAQLLLFWGVFLVVLPLVISALEERWGLRLALGAAGQPITLLGLAVLVAASALGLASAAVMATLGGGTPLPATTAPRLVIAGPYRWVRNPMAVAGIVQGAAVGALLGSWLVVGYAVLGSVVWNVAIRPHEEAELLARFGEPYAAYRAHVRCWIPRIPVG